MKRVLIALMASSLSFTASYADALRCGNKLVKTGDSKTHIIETCGEPLSDDVVEYNKEVTDKVGGYTEKGIIIRNLTYMVNGKLKILRVEGDKLTTVKNSGQR